jgi:hypothetical protein
MIDQAPLQQIPNRNTLYASNCFLCLNHHCLGELIRLVDLELVKTYMV